MALSSSQKEWHHARRAATGANCSRATHLAVMVWYMTQCPVYPPQKKKFICWAHLGSIST
ncbi:unnamed protein product [Sphenostylis stenocarpa]|uniref:Uncharacterized protein n=1 Tax=Sphenostylis stenocarpa TaxID=92480 RepID=A0AA86S000_9FABA|nr:unnamed protein product [Sphenostylis stenocarpa]